MAALLARKVPGLSSAVCRPAGCVIVTQQRHASNDFNMAALPKGRGGRSSFSGIVAAVFGGTGFVGRYLITKLGREGSQVMIPHRCDAYDLNHLKVMGDLGQMLFRDFTLESETLIKDIMNSCNVVVNLIGVDHETRNYPYEAVHIDAAGNLARYAKEAGVPRFIHMSALNANTKSDIKFLSTKGAGERAVRQEFPEATILRPALIYGPEDRYFNHFANQRFFGTVPLYFESKTCVKRPVYVADVAEAIRQCMKQKETIGQTYELMGPNGYYLDHLVEFLYRVMRRPYIKPHLPRFALRSVARMFEITPFTPWLSRSMLDMQHTTENPSSGVLGFDDLGITPTTVEAASIRVLRRHRADRYFDLGLDDVEPPQTIEQAARGSVAMS